jgi:thymidylate kinase
MIVSVSGTIGAGKSTLCSNLSGATSYTLYSEPVADNPYLEDFYKDPSRWAWGAQVFMIVHRFRRQMEAPSAVQGNGMILDRCFHEDRVFAEVNRDLGHINDRDWNTYTQLFDSFCKVIKPPDVIVYLRVNPETAIKRISKRGRESEKAVDIDYMNRLHESYEKWAIEMGEQTKVLTFNWDSYDVSEWGHIHSELMSVVGT